MNDRPPGHPTILVAEDEDQLREALVEMLLTRGFDVVGVATTGTEAVALAAASDPQLVLMDYRMPEMNGVMATEAIKERSPGTRVVMFARRNAIRLPLRSPIA